MSEFKGNYDDEAERMLVTAQAQAVCLIVINGQKGNGFSVAEAVHDNRPVVIPDLPKILRDVADDIEEQIKQQKRQ